MPDVSAKPPAGQSSPALSLDPAQVKISQRLETLKTTESGLTAAEAARRLAEYGPNAARGQNGKQVAPSAQLFLGAAAVPY